MANNCHTQKKLNELTIDEGLKLQLNKLLLNSSDDKDSDSSSEDEDDYSSSSSDNEECSCKGQSSRDKDYWKSLAEMNIPKNLKYFEIKAFSAPMDQYEWMVMPFGLKNAPNVFQRRMDEIFKKHNDYCLVYIDHILVFSRKKEYHRHHLFSVSKTIREHGIIISEKVKLETQKIDFLGFTIDQGEVIPLAEDKLIVETDTSETHWAGVLKAKSPETEHERICRYVSGTFKPAQLNYTAAEKEILAIKNSFFKFEIFTRAQCFLVRTDCKYFTTFKNTNFDGCMSKGRWLRWRRWFANFCFDVEYLAGINNSLPDALTREMSLPIIEFKDEQCLENITPSSKGKGKQVVVPTTTTTTHHKAVKFMASPVQTVTGKDKSNPFMVDTLPKSARKDFTPKQKGEASPSQTVDGKDISNPLMVSNLPKVTPPLVFHTNEKLKKVQNGDIQITCQNYKIFSKSKFSSFKKSSKEKET